MDVDLRQQLGKWACLVEVFKIRVGHAEALGRITGNIQKGRVEVCGGAVAEHSVAWVIDVTAGLELAAGIAEHHERPFPGAAVVALGTIGKIDDHRVVQHGAVAFGNRLEFLRQLGDLLKVKTANEIIHARPVHAVLASAMAGVVFALLETEAGKANIKVANACRRGNGDHVGEAGNE